MKKLLLLIFIVGIISSGCATAIKLTPQQQNSQQILFNEGNQLVFSKKENFVALGVDLYKRINAGQRADFIVIVDNNEGIPFHFSTDNITAHCKEKELKVYSFQELAAEIEKQRRSAAIVAAIGAMAGAMQAATAGHQYSHGTYNTGYGNYGTYSTYNYNQAAALQAQAAVNQQTMQNMAMIEENYKRSMNDIGNKILKITTIAPGKRYGGVVKINLPKQFKDNYVKIDVLANSETHSFYFDVSKLK